MVLTVGVKREGILFLPLLLFVATSVALSVLSVLHLHHIQSQLCLYPMVCPPSPSFCVVFHLSSKGNLVVFLVIGTVIVADPLLAGHGTVTPTEGRLHPWTLVNSVVHETETETGMKVRLPPSLAPNLVNLWKWTLILLCTTVVRVTEIEIDTNITMTIRPLTLALADVEEVRYSIGLT
jgi:hypothetical protein